MTKTQGVGPTPEVLGIVKYDNESWRFDDRVGRCYELAALGLVTGAPDGTTMVHGSWHGPEGRQRIGHAWLVLPDGAVWEPITMRVYATEDFDRWTAGEVEREFDATEARRMMLTTGNFGRWHESPHP